MSLRLSFKMVRPNECKQPENIQSQSAEAKCDKDDKLRLVVTHNHKGTLLHLFTIKFYFDLLLG